MLASFQDNKPFFDRTNKVVGQLDLLPQAACSSFKTPQTQVWEFR